MATIRRKRVLRRDGRQRRAETARASASFMAVAWEMHRAPHLAMHPAHILGSVALLSAALYACVFKRVDAPTLTLVARNRNELAQLCRATRTILRTGPVPRRVVFRLAGIERLGALEIACLGHAHGRWLAAGARVVVEGCSPRVASALSRAVLGVELHLERSPVRALDVTLH